MENSSASDKSCSFGCGAKTSDLDGPGGPSESHHQVVSDLAACKSTFVASTCWYCERAWYQISHTTEDRNREEYKEKKRRDGDVHIVLMQQRRGVIDKYMRQLNNDGVRKTCGLRVAVRTSKYQDTFFARLDDNFWPEASYNAKFGSPLQPKNNKLGHETAI